MSYQVLARKYRPQNFKELVGQEHISQALINGLQQERLHHAYLFTGTRGVGKTTIARILAKALNCEQGISGNPCCECGTCNEINEGRFIDLVEVDAASKTGVDDTRELLENVQYAPSKGRYKIYLIDEVHMFSNSSFNALLKTLEEPPPHVKFLLATTEPRKLPVTVLSRCLQFNLKRLTSNQIGGYLAHLLKLQDISFEDTAIPLISHAADGSMRDGLSLLDQALAFGAGKIESADVKLMLGTIDQNKIGQLFIALMNGDADSLLETMNSIFEMSVDYSRAHDEMSQLMHEVSLYQILKRQQDSSMFSRDLINELAQGLSEEQVQLYYQIILKGKSELGLAPNRHTGFEMTVLRLFAFEFGEPSQSQSLNKSTSQVKPIQTKSIQTPQAKPITPKPIQSTNSNRNPAPTQNDQTVQVIKSVQLSTPITSESWEQTFNQLQLKGTARELARNAHVVSNKDDTLTLSIDSQAHIFMTDKAQQRLTDALVQGSKENLKVNFVKSESNKNTIAQKQQVEQKNQERSTHDAATQNEFVQHLQSEFDAEIIDVKQTNRPR